MRSFIFLLSLLLAGLTALAQPVKKHATAIPASGTVRIDGVLDEPAWVSAVPAAGFLQKQPYNGSNATFVTEVKFLYDNTGLYIGAKMYDSRPDSIPGQLGLRDSESLNADNFTVVISPFNDGLNAFCFMVYVSDVQSDFKLTGPESDSDFSWDAVWKSKARKSEEGWSVEMKIPYSAIRFPGKAVQEWGINCQREIRRYREIDTWNLVDSKISGYLNQCGILKGIHDIKPPLRLSLTPYVSGYMQNTSEDKEYDFSYNYGADLKYGIDQSFTLDMTLIPDFGQVKSDDRVYNFSPFEIRYDERRQFFTEGTEMFNKGGIFYTRRIGGEPRGYDIPEEDLKPGEIITDNPSKTKLINASKVSGRTAGGLGVGIFNAVSANTWATVTDTGVNSSRRLLTQGFTNYNTFVLDQNLKNNSYLDFLNTNYFMPTEGYTANVTGSSFKFANKDYTYALVGDAFISQKYYSHNAPDFGSHYALSFGNTSGNFRFNCSQLLETPHYDPNDMGFNPVNNRFNNQATFEYNLYDPVWKVLNWYNSGEVSYNTLYDGLKFTSLEFQLESNTTTLKHLSMGAFSLFSPIPSHDYYEPRVPGWMYIAPASGSLTNWISTDYRKKFAIDVSLSGSIAPSQKMSSYGIGVEPRYRISDRIFMVYSFEYEKTYNDIGFVDSVYSDGYTIWFGRRDPQTIENILEANYMLSSSMSIDIRARHYWVSAQYLDFSVLQRDGTLKPAVYSEDPDVNYNLFNIDLTYIWNFAPGSQLSVMWKNAISTFDNDPQPDFFRDFRKTVSAPPSNSFSIRLLFYLDALYFKK